LDLRESTYDEEGNLLDEKPIDANKVDRRKKITTVRNIVEDLIQRPKSSNEGLNFLIFNIRNVEAFFIKLCLPQCKLHKKNMKVYWLQDYRPNINTSINKYSFKK
jgi:hypothetical protein